MKRPEEDWEVVGFSGTMGTATGGKGDVMIDAEPGGLPSGRFGEKGTLRVTFTVTTKGLRTGRTRTSAKGANRVASRLVDPAGQDRGGRPPGPGQVDRRPHGPGRR